MRAVPAPTGWTGQGVYGVLDDDGQTVACHECGRRYRALVTHLARAHAMSCAEYRQAHGLGATRPLASAGHQDLVRAIGRRRWVEDPRVRAALEGPQAEVTRHGPAPARDVTRAGNLLAVRQAAAARADAHWAQLLSAAGFDTLAGAVAWAHEAGAGWAGLAVRLGCSQTPLRRRGEAAGLTLDRLPGPAVDTTAAYLEAARAHAAAHGDLNATTGQLARWLASRRHLRAHRPAGTATAVDQALDGLDPTWSIPRHTRTAYPPQAATGQSS